MPLREAMGDAAWSYWVTTCQLLGSAANVAFCSRAANPLISIGSGSRTLLWGHEGFRAQSRRDGMWLRARRIRLSDTPMVKGGVIESITRSLRNRQIDRRNDPYVRCDSTTPDLIAARLLTQHLRIPLLLAEHIGKVAGFIVGLKRRGDDGVYRVGDKRAVGSYCGPAL